MSQEVFHDWLADQFGKSGHIPKSALQIGQWFCDLPSDERELVREFIQNWSFSALTKLIKIPIALITDLARESKLTPTAIKELVAESSNKERKLRVNGYAEVRLSCHELNSQVGRVVSRSKEGNVVLEMSGGKFSFKSDALKAVAKPRGFQSATNSLSQSSNQAQQQKQQIEHLSTIVEQQKLQLESYKNPAASLPDSDADKFFTQADLDSALAQKIQEYEQKKSQEYAGQSEQLRAVVFEEVKAAAFEQIRAAIFEEVRSEIEAVKSQEIEALNQKNEKSNQALQQTLLELESAYSQRFRALETENQKFRQQLQILKVSKSSSNNLNLNQPLTARENYQSQSKNKSDLPELDLDQLQSQSYALSPAATKVLAQEQIEEVKVKFMAQSHRERETDNGKLLQTNEDLQRKNFQLKKENEALKFQALAPNVKEFERYVLSRSRSNSGPSHTNTRAL